MVRQLFIGTAACLALAAPAWAINKCTGADGKVAFQDAPCTGGKGEKVEVRLSSGGVGTAAPAAAATVPAASPASGASAAAPTPAPAAAPGPKREGAFGETWRRKTDLEQHEIGNARGALNAHLQRCSAEQRELAAKKGYARNNLAGATWEQSISAEMQAAATSCDTRARELRSRLEALEKELRELSKK